MSINIVSVIYAERQVFIVMLSVAVLSVVMLSVVKLSVLAPF